MEDTKQTGWSEEIFRHGYANDHSLSPPPNPQYQSSTKKPDPTFSEKDGEDFRNGVPGLYVNVIPSNCFSAPREDLYVRVEGYSVELASKILGYMDRIMNCPFSSHTGMPYINSPEKDCYVIREDIAGYSADITPSKAKKLKPYQEFYKLMRKCVRNMTPPGSHVQLRVVKEKEPSNGEEKVVPSGRKAK